MREEKKKEKENTCKPRNFPLSHFFFPFLQSACNWPLPLPSFFVSFYTKKTSMESQVFLAAMIKIILIRIGTTC